MSVNVNLFVLLIFLLWCTCVPTEERNPYSNSILDLQLYSMSAPPLPKPFCFKSLLFNFLCRILKSLESFYSLLHSQLLPRHHCALSINYFGLSSDPVTWTELWEQLASNWANSGRRVQLQGLSSSNSGTAPTHLGPNPWGWSSDSHHERGSPRLPAHHTQTADAVSWCSLGAEHSHGHNSSPASNQVWLPREYKTETLMKKNIQKHSDVQS